MSYKIGMISLGCPKNQVDAEMMLAKLKAAGFEITNRTKNADLVIVNTCGFIEDAKREAIENILEMARLKEQGTIKKLVVTGCLAERYQDEVQKEMPEIDVVAGIGANGDIVRLCQKALEGEGDALFPPKSDMPLGGGRILTTPSHWAYLKVADGCSNCCSYCAIPGIRGPFRSRPLEELVEEAKTLANGGVKELILIAQDTTRYGVDLYGSLELPHLLDQICAVEGIEWIRLFYCYPDRITEELLQTMKRQPKILPYLDLPLQHANEAVLHKMNRTGSKESLTKLIHHIREVLPDAALRTTVMAGFPYEDEAAFEELCLFVREMEFDRLGCFAYSPEEGTPSAEFPHQVAEDKKKRRAELVMEEQYTVMERKNKARIGKVYTVLVDGYDSAAAAFEGRSYMDAPEIDTKIFFSSAREPEPGSFVRVKITDMLDYDLIGEEVEDAVS